MSIQQRVVLTKLATDDGRWDFRKSGIPVGYEFWVDCNSFAIKHFLSEGSHEFSALMVKTEAGTWLPAEVLEYKSEFQLK